MDEARNLSGNFVHIANRWTPRTIYAEFSNWIVILQIEDPSIIAIIC